MQSETKEFMDKMKATDVSIKNLSSVNPGSPEYTKLKDQIELSIKVDHLRLLKSIEEKIFDIAKKFRGR